jgi:hypothetical protein
MGLQESLEQSSRQEHRPTVLRPEEALARYRIEGEIDEPPDREAWQATVARDAVSELGLVDSSRGRSD